MEGDNPEYDSYGFRVGSSQAALGEATPQVVLQNRCHKWQRVLETFAATPRSKVESLIYEGVPDAVRAEVWTALVFNAPGGSGQSRAERDSNYRKLLLMPDNKAVEQIRLDLARTLTHHRMFEEKSGTGQQKLLRVLKAYSYFNPTVGYCQGMSYLAAILLTVLPEEEAFHGLCAVVAGMEGYFVPTMWELLEDGKIFKSVLAEHMPDVHAHLQENGILPLMFMCKWFMTMFSQLPWATVLRVFDLYLLEGKTSLFRFGYSILDVHRRELLALGSIDVLLPYLLEPQSRKLLPHVLVPHALTVPMEHYVRTAVANLRDGQDLLAKCAAANTPAKRASSVTSAAAVPKASLPKPAAASAAPVSANSSFFDRFLSSISTPVRAHVVRRLDTTSEQPRVVATPPASARRGGTLNFGSPLSPSSARLNTPPLFEGMKKRVRAVPIDGAENDRGNSPAKRNHVHAE